MREKVKMQQELEKTRLLESQRMQESQMNSSTPNAKDPRFKDQMRLTVSISGVHELKTSNAPNSKISQSVDGSQFSSAIKPGKLPFFGQNQTHWVKRNQFKDENKMRFAFTDSNSDRHYNISVDLLLLKELGSSEGW